MKVGLVFIGVAINSILAVQRETVKVEVQQSRSCYDIAQIKCKKLTSLVYSSSSGSSTTVAQLQAILPDTTNT